MKKLIVFIVLTSCISDQVTVVEPVLSDSTPEAQGVSSKAILDFIDAAEASQPDALHSLMVVRNGKVAAEGWWDPYNPESPHLLYSLSKSFTSTAIGLAIQEELISLDDQVVDFFPDQAPDSISENLSRMRIRDLLKMNSGHRYNTSQRMRNEEGDWVKGFLSLEVEHKPGTIFVYNSGASYMLSAIIQKRTGKTLSEYLKTRLYDPLSIGTPEWQSDQKGIDVGGWGLSVTTEDIAKFGQLYLQNGMWEGNQIIPKWWVEQATSYRTSNGSSPESDWDQGYGYQFWRCRNNSYRGDGAFGQFCIVIPEKQAVIAITAGSNDMQGILNLVWDHLYPAMKDEAIPPNDDAFESLNARLDNLKLSLLSDSDIPGSSAYQKGSYDLATNELDLKSVKFNLEGDEKEIEISTSGQQDLIAVGSGKLAYSTATFPVLGTVNVATSGAWIAEDTFQVKMIDYESPHTLTYTFKFTPERLDMNAKINVGFGPNKAIDIAGTRNEEAI